MEDDRIYQDDRIGKIKEFNTCLRKSLACIGHRKYEIARDCFDDAVRCGLEVVRDENQFYMKELFNTYHKYYAAFKKIKYNEGAKWNLLQIVAYLRRMHMPKEQKTRILADIIRKYEASGGDRVDVKSKWQNPID